MFHIFVMDRLIINAMTTIELEAKRMGILRRILAIEDEASLQQIENLLQKLELPIMEGYSPEALRDAVVRSQEDIRNGHTYTQGQMRAKHPRK